MSGNYLKGYNMQTRIGNFVIDWRTLPFQLKSYAAIVYVWLRWPGPGGFCLEHAQPHSYMGVGNCYACHLCNYADHLDELAVIHRRGILRRKLLAMIGYTDES